MDTIVNNRAAPPSDYFAARQAPKPVNTAENPVEKTVVETKETAASPARDPRASAVSAEQAATIKSQAPEKKDNLEHKYVALPDNTFAYRVVNEGTKQVVIQLPSEQALKLRAYLAQEEAKKAQHAEDTKGQVENLIA